MRGSTLADPFIIHLVRLGFATRAECDPQVRGLDLQEELLDVVDRYDIDQSNTLEKHELFQSLLV